MEPRKRWVALAAPNRGKWQIAAPHLVGPPGQFLTALRQAAGGAPVALGVDFPLGLPRAYAARHVSGSADFPDFLRRLDGLPDFLVVARTLEDIAPGRPFYPARGIAGMTRAAHAAALGLASAAALSRACDRATVQRPAGAPLFWTLGANQSGKAAIAAWRDMLLPALSGPDPPRLWPFEGPFRSLLAPGRVAIAETYPAEALRQLDLRLSGSKRRQADRAALAPGLRRVMGELGAHPDPHLETMLAGGFGADPAGEDRFDCVLGLLCVLGVLQGRRPDTAPDDPWIRCWEGWVLGQTALPKDFSSAVPLPPATTLPRRP